MTKPEPNSIWQHYKDIKGTKLYKVIGVSISSKETVGELKFLGKDTETLEDLAIYTTVKDNFKVYKAQINNIGEIEKHFKVITEPYVIYTKLDNSINVSVVWCRPLSSFTSFVDETTPRFKQVIINK